MQSQPHNHHLGPLGVIVSFGVLALLAATWDVGAQAAGAFVLALLGAAAIGWPLLLMAPQDASRHLWTWSMSIPIPCLLFADFLRHAPSLLPLAVAVAVAWFYLLIVWGALLRFVKAHR